MNTFLKDLAARVFRTETLAVIAAIVLVATKHVTDYQQALAVGGPVVALVLGRSHVKAAAAYSQFTDALTADIPPAIEAAKAVEAAAAPAFMPERHGPVPAPGTGPLAQARIAAAAAEAAAATPPDTTVTPPVAS